MRLRDLRASLSVYPEAYEKIEIELIDKELRVDTFMAASLEGAGGDKEAA